MRRFWMIINLILGKDIIVYDTWRKEVLMIIGSDEEVIKKRYSYDFIGKNEECLEGDAKTGKIYYTGDRYE
jgi:hypothetical protein